MPYQTDLLEALKDWSLNVVEVNGWRTHGSSSFNPGGSVNHHTAGSTSNSIPSLKILRDGRSDLPGPLCNVGQSRSSNFNTSAKYDDVYLIAAGRANHAGSGGWRGLVGNSSVFGLEIEHCGYLDREPFPERRQHTAYRIHRAFAEIGGFSIDMVCQHKEWTPRKIDFVGANGSSFRSSTAAAVKYSAPVPTNPEEDEMLEEIKNFMIIYLKYPNDPREWTKDQLKNYNHHLWLLLTRQKTLEDLRASFQMYAGL